MVFIKDTNKDVSNALIVKTGSVVTPLLLLLESWQENQQCQLNETDIHEFLMKKHKCLNKAMNHTVIGRITLQPANCCLVVGNAISC